MYDEPPGLTEIWEHNRSSGRITETWLRQLLGRVYESLLLDLGPHQPAGPNEGEDLIDALLEASRETTEGGRQAGSELALRERLIRLARACLSRVAELNERRADLIEDLPLLDALQDVASGQCYGFDWRIDQKCQLLFD